MDIRVVLIMVGNCCVVPGLAFALGVAWAKGWLRSPFARPGNGAPAPAASDEWSGNYENE